MAALNVNSFSIVMVQFGLADVRSMLIFLVFSIVQSKRYKDLCKINKIKIKFKMHVHRFSGKNNNQII